MKLGTIFCLFPWQPSAADGVKMGLSEEDRIFKKKIMYQFEGYGAKRLMKEFPTNGWKKTILNNF